MRYDPMIAVPMDENLHGTASPDELFEIVKLFLHRVIPLTFDSNVERVRKPYLIVSPSAGRTSVFDTSLIYAGVTLCACKVSEDISD
jgi:hypothetical protein